MASAEGKDDGGRSPDYHAQEKGPHSRDIEKEDREGREAERHGPSYTDRINNENLDRERHGEMQRHIGGHRIRDNEKQDQDGLGGGYNAPSHTDDTDPSLRQKDLHVSLTKRDSLHDARAHDDFQSRKKEDDEPTRDDNDASGAHRQQKPRSAEDFSSDHHVKNHDVDNVRIDHSWRRRDVVDASRHRHHRSRDDVFKEYKQRNRGADDVLDHKDAHDVAGDRRERRHDASDDGSRRQERGVDDNHNRKKRDVDDIRRRWDADDVPDNRKERRRNADDNWDNHSRQRRDLKGDKRNRSRGVDDDDLRRQDADDVPGDSSRGRHHTDGEIHAQRRRYADDGFDNRRHHGDGVRDRQQLSPRKRRSHHEKRDTEDDGGRDHFYARFDNGERNENELPELFSVHRAKVQSVRPFGVFVRLEGFYKQGLVHLSQLSDHEVTDREDSDEKKVQAIAAVAGEGDQVWVKVISLKDDGGGVKIGCSLKLVSQSTGKDLDPNNLKLYQQQPKGNRQDPKKVTLDAIYDVVCSRCGGHGHLKTECYGTADKSYELLPEEDNDLTEQLLQPLQTRISAGEASVKPGFGRGRAMVLPAWMTQGSGVNATQHIGSEPEKKQKKINVSELPDKITTVEEAMALIAQVKKAKKDKHHRKEHRKHKKDKKSKKASKKKSSSRKDRA